MRLALRSMHCVVATTPRASRSTRGRAVHKEPGPVTKETLAEMQKMVESVLAMHPYLQERHVRQLWDIANTLDALEKERLQRQRSTSDDTVTRHTDNSV